MLTLRPLSITDEAVFKEILCEFKESEPNFEFGVFYSDDIPFSEYVRRLDAWSKGLELQAGKVPHSFLLALVGSEIVGRVSIRHSLNDFLKKINGHIGYGVRPKFRKKGYAKDILRKSLKICKDLGLKQVMLTCDDKNIGSIKTIESNGGILKEKFQLDDDPILKRRYWITI